MALEKQVLIFVVLVTSIGCSRQPPSTSQQSTPAPIPDAEAEVVASEEVVDRTGHSSTENNTSSERPLAQPATPDEVEVGLAIGVQAPEFKLLDQHGQERSLSGLLKQGHVALVFYRSADW